MSLDVMELSGPRGADGSLTAGWNDAAWRRLMAAVAEPGLVWASVEHCARCARPLAGGDCEPDPHLCWSPVTGRCG